MLESIEQEEEFGDEIRCAIHCESLSKRREQARYLTFHSSLIVLISLFLGGPYLRLISYIDAAAITEVIVVNSVDLNRQKGGHAVDRRLTLEYVASITGAKSLSRTACRFVIYPSDDTVR